MRKMIQSGELDRLKKVIGDKGVNDLTKKFSESLWDRLLDELDKNVDATKLLMLIFAFAVFVFWVRL